MFFCLNQKYMNISAKITDFTKMSANFAKVNLGKLFAEIRKNVQTSANVEFGAVQTLDSKMKKLENQKPHRKSIRAVNTCANTGDFEKVLHKMASIPPRASYDKFAV